MAIKVGYIKDKKSGDIVLPRTDASLVAGLPDEIPAISSGTTEYWNAQVGYIPAENEIVVYTDYQVVDDGNGGEKLIPGIKIGSGNGYVQDLGFLGEAEAASLLEHINDQTRHITAAERLRWDNKLNVQGVVDDVLIFNRN